LLLVAGLTALARPATPPPGWESTARTSRRDRIALLSRARW